MDLISQNRTVDGNKTFYHNDGLGSTRALTDLNGDVVNRYTYDVFGRTILESGSTGNVYLFAGEQRDVSGLNYFIRQHLGETWVRFVCMATIVIHEGPDDGQAMGTSGCIEIGTGEWSRFLRSIEEFSGGSRLKFCQQRVLPPLRVIVAAPQPRTAQPVRSQNRINPRR